MKGQLTSFSFPVATSKTKPRTESFFGMNGLFRIRATDWRTSLSRSQPPADGEGSDLVLGDHAAGVADDVGFAFLKTKHAVDNTQGYLFDAVVRHPVTVSAAQVMVTMRTATASTRSASSPA